MIKEFKIKFKLKPFYNYNKSTEIEVDFDLNSFLSIEFKINNYKDLNINFLDQNKERLDGLWERTCFEFFLSTGQQYLEFNMTPSGGWNCYYFDSYRKGMREYEQIKLKSYKELKFEFNGVIPFDIHYFNISAVIELKEGRNDFYSFAHNESLENADFHNLKTFKKL